MFQDIPPQMVITACWVIGIPMLFCFIDLFIFGRKRKKQLDSDPNGIPLGGSRSYYQSSIFWFIFYEVLCVVAVMIVAVIFVGDMYVYTIIETGKLPPSFIADICSHGGFGFLLAIAVFGLCVWPNYFINWFYATLYITEECFDIRSISLIRPMLIYKWDRVYSVTIYNDTASQSGIKQVMIVIRMPNKGLYSSAHATYLPIPGKHPSIHEIIDRIKTYAPEKISYL